MTAYYSMTLARSISVVISTRACAKSVNHTPSFRRRPESRLRTGRAVTGVSDFAQALSSALTDVLNLHTSQIVY